MGLPRTEMMLARLSQFEEAVEQMCHGLSCAILSDLNRECSCDRARIFAWIRYIKNDSADSDDAVDNVTS